MADDYPPVTPALANALRFLAAGPDASCRIDHHGYCQAHLMEDTTAGPCSIAVIVDYVATLDPAPADDATTLAITLALAGSPPPLSHDSLTGVRCTLCDATAPGAAATLPDSQHHPACPWASARAYEARMADATAAADYHDQQPG